MDIILGIDEVGRGCWAGPLVAGAVILKNDIEGLRDSKKLSATKRVRLAKQIHAQSHVGLGWVSPQEVDSLGLTKAVGLAMERAVAKISEDYSHMVIDGSINYFPNEKRAIAVIKADDSVPAVSAASIVAKVARDTHMAEIATLHPSYGFEKHVGYGTKQHIEALARHGVTSLHRRSYKPIQEFLSA